MLVDHQIVDRSEVLSLAVINRCADGFVRRKVGRFRQWPPRGLRCYSAWCALRSKDLSSRQRRYGTYRSAGFAAPCLNELIAEQLICTDCNYDGHRVLWVTASCKVACLKRRRKIREQSMALRKGESVTRPIPLASFVMQVRKVQCQAEHLGGDEHPISQ
jgi:hypothetical protein